MRVASHPILCHDPVLLKFLQSDREWAELDVNADGGKYVQQAEFKLKSISAALRLKKPDSSFDEIRHYSSALQVFIEMLNFDIFYGTLYNYNVFLIVKFKWLAEISCPSRWSPLRHS